MSLRDQLQAIYDEFGHLTPELVVEVARPKTHPLHARVFDKNQKEAAESWYRVRAQELITSVKVTYRDAEGRDAKTLRGFYAIKNEDPENGGYRYEPVDSVTADPFQRALVLRDMERDWKQLRARYETFAEFTEMIRKDIAS